MKWKGRPQSRNIEDRRKKKSAFSKGGKLNYSSVQGEVINKVAKKKARKARVNGR